jgi:SAM-dependent methyltransferase
MDVAGAMLFEKYALTLFQPGMRVLEVGPENVPSIHERMVGNAEVCFEYLDIVERGPGVIWAKDEYEYPISDGTYDIVLSSMVLEHVKKPWHWVPELARITKPGGYVVTVVPVNWPYHCWPVDCWRVYGEGMMALYEDAGLKTVLAITQEMVDGVIHTLGVGFKEER